jgi:hypothetical protein
MVRLRFLFTGLLVSAVNLCLNAMAYAFVLRDVYRSCPGVSEECSSQYGPSPDELIVWAMALTSLSMGYFITLVMKWSWARTFVTGIKYGAVVGFLFWISVNSGIYASSRMFSFTGLLADTFCSGLSMTLSAAVAAWMLGKADLRKGKV